MFAMFEWSGQVPTNQEVLGTSLREIIQGVFGRAVPQPSCNPCGAKLGSLAEKAPPTILGPRNPKMRYDLECGAGKARLRIAFS